MNFVGLVIYDLNLVNKIVQSYRGMGGAGFCEFRLGERDASGPVRSPQSLLFLPF